MATVIHPPNLQLLRSHFPLKPPPPPLQRLTSLSLLNAKPHHRNLFCFSSKTQPLPKYPKLLSLLDSTLIPDDSSSTHDLFRLLFAKYSSLLHLSVQCGDTELARAVHACVLKFEEDSHMRDALITAYLKLGLVQDAYRVFMGLSCPDVVSYTALIRGFAKSNREDEAVRFFTKMMTAGVVPNEYSFVAILTACTKCLELELGLQLHDLVIKTGHLDSVFVVNNLMGLYVKFDDCESVVKLFDEMPQRDIASWNTVILSMVKELMYDKAFELFRSLQLNDGFRVDYFTVSTMLTACAGSNALLQGQEVHAHAIKIGLETNLSVNNALIGFYTKCSRMKDAVTLFQRMPVRDVITWTEMIATYMEFGMVDLALETFEKMPEKNSVSYNAILAGFCKNSEGLKALKLFTKMVEEGLELTDFSLTSIVNACSLLMDAKISKQIHGFCIKFGFGSNTCIEAALLDMCTRCGRITDAEKMFHKWPSDQDNSVVCTSLACGYARNGQPDDAISLFCRSLKNVDEVALTSVLGVCGTLGFYQIGEGIHSHAIKTGFMSDLGVSNSIISMYAKCGNMNEATKVFNSMPTQDVVTWNALISGHLLDRQGDKALAVWSRMLEAGINPDAITLILVISAYRHTNSNTVDDCRKLFMSMKTKYDIEPTSEHYAAFIGALGKWVPLEEAEQLVNKMPFEPDISVWRALLDSCRIHLNTTIGKRVAKHILAIGPQDPSTYILVSNLYSASGRWHCSNKSREDMQAKGFHKHPARSWTIHEKKLQTFYARDKSHPQSEDIYSELEKLILECLKAGYVPDTSFVLHEVEEHQKKDFLYYHSAKLAVTYKLLVSKPREPIQIVKNILLCGDCHTFLKHVSTATKRDIVVRDASGFHYFSAGKCSCRDCW